MGAKKTTDITGRVIRKERVVHAPLAKVWDAWTTAKGAQAFFAPKAVIGLFSGGPYEIWFDPKDERMGTKGLKVLSVLPKELLSFQWNAPPHLPEVRKVPTWVVVQLEELEPHTTGVVLTHLGWRRGGQWDQAFKYFQRAWDIVLGRLEHRFEEGPIDWKDPFTPGKEAR